MWTRSSRCQAQHVCARTCDATSSRGTRMQGAPTGSRPNWRRTWQRHNSCRDKPSPAKETPAVGHKNVLPKAPTRKTTSVLEGRTSVNAEGTMFGTSRWVQSSKRFRVIPRAISSTHCCKCCVRVRTAQLRGLSLGGEGYCWSPAEFACADNRSWNVSCWSLLMHYVAFQNLEGTKCRRVFSSNLGKIAVASIRENS